MEIINVLLVLILVVAPIVFGIGEILRDYRDTYKEYREKNK